MKVFENLLYMHIFLHLRHLGFIFFARHLYEKQVDHVSAESILLIKDHLHNDYTIVFIYFDS